MQQSNLVETPHGRSAIRALAFVAGADEIGRIDTVNKKDLNIGRIGVALDAVHKALGRSEREFSRTDDKQFTLLKDAFESAYDVRIRNRAHLYNEIKRNICEEREIYGKKAQERDRISQFLRKIAGKLTNGHAGTWI